MLSYDLAVIQQFAEMLYKRARQIVATYTFLGLLIGGVSGFFLGATLGHRQPNADQWTWTGAGGGAVLIGALCYSAAMAKVFQMRLSAQTALCQMMIERNTRAPGGQSNV